MKHNQRSERPWLRHIFSWAFRLLLGLLLVTTSSLSFFSSAVLALSVTSYPAPLPEGQVNVAYSATLTASGTAPFTWGTAVGLPTGLSLTPSNNVAVISGTPTTAGSFAFTVTVQDASPATFSFASSIIINPPPFTITTTDLPQGKEGTAYGAALSASGGTTPYTWSLVSGSLPLGVVLGGSTGYISGTPSRGSYGTFTFMVNVNDSSSPTRSAQRSFTIYIEKGVFKSTISIDSSLKAGSTRVSVDGKTVNTLKGGEYINIDFDLGITRTISVEPLITNPSDSNIRYKATRNQ